MKTIRFFLSLFLLASHLIVPSAVTTTAYAAPLATGPCTDVGTLPTITPTPSIPTPTRTATRTNTLIPATATRTNTALPVTPTRTATAVLPTSTRTNTVVPATATRTATRTSTALPVTPTPTATRTSTTVPSTPTRTSTALPATPTRLPELIFRDGFESGNLATWSGAATDGGNLSVNTAAALRGSYGMSAVVNDNNAIFVTDELPNGEALYRARFYFDPNTTAMAANDSFFLLMGYKGTTDAIFGLELGYLSGYRLRLALRDDPSIGVTSNWVSLSDAPHYLEIAWAAAAAPGANNGSLALWVDGAQQADLANVDNDIWRLDRVQLGAANGIDSGTRGTLYFDAFESRRNTYIGPDGEADIEASLSPVEGSSPLLNETGPATVSLTTTVLLPTNPLTASLALQETGSISQATSLEPSGVFTSTEIVSEPVGLFTEVEITGEATALPITDEAGAPTGETAPQQAEQPQNTDAPQGVNAAPSISNVQIVTPNIGRYDRFEVQFDLQTVATNPDMPYDAAPPSGVKPGIGVTVNALFSADNWQTFEVQPAFRYQPYTYSLRGGKDHLTPNGAPRWAVRFAPKTAGNWQFRLCAADAAGTSYSPATSNPALGFSVATSSANPYTRHGFLRTSPTDERYFEYADGTPFIGVGYNDGFSNSSTVESKMVAYEQSKMNFMRVWMSGAGINGSQWSSWTSPFLPNDGYLPGVYFNTQNTYNGADVSMVLDSSNPCLFGDFWQGGIPVEPNTTYNISARVKLVGVTGPAASGAYGFVVKQAGWLDTACAQPNNGTLITTPASGTTDWVTLTGSYTTSSSQYWLDNLYLARQNATGGTVYIDEVRVWRANDPAQVNVLREPNVNSHLYFDPMNAAQWDRFIQSAEQHGVFLKLVIDEKNEWLRNHINASGAVVPAASNDNFYAAPGTKVRWLEQAWWRYIIARWGYSTAVHSFEFINEGDPYNGHHYEAANSMARYMHQNDPSRHMVTTSFWASFPNREFWSNPAYADIDYADIHAYISTGWGLTASFLPASLTETNAANVRTGNASARITAASAADAQIAPRGTVIQGAGEWILRYWMKASSFSANCAYGSTGGMQRLRWKIDGGWYGGGKEGVVPFNSAGQDFICTSPAGTYGWTQFSSDRDRSGVLLPETRRIVITDNNPHELMLRLENSNGTGGTAWIDDVELVSPSGVVQPVIGQFDINAMDEDTAWYTHAYADVWGGESLVGARKPLVRGEGGIDSPTQQDWNRDLLLDTQGIWLHNNVWGQINDGGMADLFWWAAETIPQSLYGNFLTFRNFMEGIPLSNGHYAGIATQLSNPQLRVWGQRDDVNGRMHLWIQNTQHTWKRVVHGPAITPVTGTVTILNVPAGSYTVQWWNTYATSNPIFLTQTVVANGSLTLALPNALADDVAVKITRLP